ncbi:translation initiation factor IF-2, partial [bacterium]|nr:translation initiation factor IF-2 [bacterium]
KNLLPKKVQEEIIPVKKEIVIQPMTPADIAKIVGEPSTGVILTLLKWGIVCPKNQMLVKDVVARLAKHYEITVIKPESNEYDEEFDSKDSKAASLVDVKKEKFETRPPVVVVMGHVDHGKTTLLDFVRKTRVAAKEKGGITQHLGAYEVETSHGGLVFLDTPGHEAFTKIRMRGAKVADIVVLVIAADDSIMPQTIEAIKHAKNMEVPIVVAINKVDKVEQHQIEAVKRDLSQHDLLTEDWGGQTVAIPISAKLGQGVDTLLEMIALQAEMAELKADKTVSARGYILESKLEKGRGAVATLICQHGTIKKGDFFVCGKTVGKVNSLTNSNGEQISSAGPSVPVQVSGFSELPEAGDFLRVVSQREYKKSRSSKSSIEKSVSKVVAVEGDINIIVKTDTKSSREALLGSIAKLSKKLEKGFHIIHSAVGDINESDIALASTTGSRIVGLHIKAEPNAATLARRNFIHIQLYDIIYKLIEDLEEYSESKKEIKKVNTKIGEAVVLRVFDIKNVGVIAGCAVKDGRCTRNSSLVVWRGKTKVGEGKIKSLQREKKTVKEVHAGFECGFLIDGFADWEVDDRVECYLEIAPDQKK